MKKYIHLFAIALVIVSASSRLFAQEKAAPAQKACMSENMKCSGNDASQAMAPKHAGQGMVKRLKLTPEQEKKFDDLRAAHQKAAIDTRAKIEKNKIELGQMLKQGNIDEKKLIDLTDENSKLQAELKKAGIKHWLEVYKMLDKDQKEIWTKVLVNMGNPKMMKERMQSKMKNFMMERRGRMNSKEQRGW